MVEKTFTVRRPLFQSGSEEHYSVQEVVYQYMNEQQIKIHEDFYEQFKTQIGSQYPGLSSQEIASFDPQRLMALASTMKTVCEAEYKLKVDNLTKFVCSMAGLELILLGAQLYFFASGFSILVALGFPILAVVGLAVMVLGACRCQADMDKNAANKYIMALEALAAPFGDAYFPADGLREYLRR